MHQRAPSRMPNPPARFLERLPPAKDLAPPPSRSRDARVGADLAALTTAPCVAATSVALPAHRYEQKELASAAARLLPAFAGRQAVLERFFSSTGVTARHLALDADAYAELSGLGARSRAWLEVATDLGERAIGALLEDAGVTPRDVGLLTTTTVTGIAVPSLDARLMNRLPFSADLKRVPLFGLGCVGGAAGLARTAEYLRAFPRQLAVLLSVELCSLTVQADDGSVANVISSGLFGDGAAAVLLAGARHPLSVNGGGAVGPRVVASRSTFFPDTERVMGWDIVDRGFKVVLSRDVPTIVREAVPPAVDRFLDDHGLTRRDIATWICHPGGPKVMTALEEGLGLPDDALDASRAALADVGNLSSASVLYLLDEYRAHRRPAEGAAGILMAMGPAFCAELVLLRW
ncbi:MAG: type III polyketide synthase [Sandaracinaceae bacterium]